MVFLHNTVSEHLNVMEIELFEIEVGKPQVSWPQGVKLLRVVKPQGVANLVEVGQVLNQASIVH